MKKYTVKRCTSGTVTMSGGLGHGSHEEPAVTAFLYVNGQLITSVPLNCTTMCLPEGGIRGTDATDEQIIRAVLGDENIFTAAPAYPEYHDELLNEETQS